MNKEQALIKIFTDMADVVGMKAYDELSIPDDAKLPYWTYRVSTASMGELVLIPNSMWDRSSEWKRLSEATDKIDKYLSNGGVTQTYDGGMVWLYKGSPFSQRQLDPTDASIKRMYLVMQAEFIS